MRTLLDGIDGLAALQAMAACLGIALIAADAPAYRLCCLLLAAAPAVAETIAITDGRVHTIGPAGTFKKATVLIRDGRIDMIASSITPRDPVWPLVPPYSSNRTTQP